MATIQITPFNGMIPLRAANVLPDTNADYCLDACLYSGNLIGFRTASPVYTLLSSTTLSVYRIPGAGNPSAQIVGSTWLEFPDPFMSVIRSPIAEDSFKRYYFFPSTSYVGTNPGPQYTTLDRLHAGLAPYTLGIPAPETAPGVSYSGGTEATQEVRTYLYTWQSAYGEEGPPGPNTILQGTVDGTWSITLTPPLPADLANRNLTVINLYRIVTDTSGSALFYRITQLDISATSYTDTVLDAAATSGLNLESSYYTAPPQDLQGVVTMANGILAGWSNKREVWFSAAFLPHAWPAPYALTTDADIIAMAAVGTSLIVLTASQPWVFTGATPDTVTGGRIAAREPCISRGSVAWAGEGIYYASPNGLIMANTMGTQNASQSIITKEQWNAANPINFMASKYSVAYAAFVRGASGAQAGLLIDHINPMAPFTWLSSNGIVNNVYNDEYSGGTFVVTPTSVYEWHPSTVTSAIPYTWRSKKFRFPFPQQFVAGKIQFSVPAWLGISAPTETTRNTSQWQTFNPATQYLLLKVYVDGQLVYVRELIESGELLMLPSGFKATYWQFELSGQVEVTSMEFGTSTKELQRV